MAEWILEEGIGESRAALVEGGQIVEARIVREDGLGGLFRGAGPTVVRAMALNMGMLASNDQVKEMIADAGYPGQPAIVGGSLIAGFFAVFFVAFFLAVFFFLAMALFLWYLMAIRNRAIAAKSP